MAVVKNNSKNISELFKFLEKEHSKLLIPDEIINNIKNINYKFKKDIINQRLPKRCQFIYNKYNLDKLVEYMLSYNKHLIYIKNLYNELNHVDKKLIGKFKDKYSLNKEVELLKNILILCRKEILEIFTDFQNSKFINTNICFIQKYNLDPLAMNIFLNIFIKNNKYMYEDKYINKNGKEVTELIEYNEDKIKSLLPKFTYKKSILYELRLSNYLLKSKNFSKNYVYEKNNEIILNEYKTEVLRSYFIKDKNNLLNPKNNEENNDVYDKIGAPIFLQEFYYIFYLALKIIKTYYKNNSCIISLGESPAKLVMTQSFFYDDSDVKKILNPDVKKILNPDVKKILNPDEYPSKDKYPSNIDFKYLPLSGLSWYALNNKSEINLAHRTVEESINILKKQINNEDIEKFESYLKIYLLDPRSIISTNKKYIFLDRVESCNTTITLFYIYSELILRQKLTEEQKQKFITQFKLVGFDGFDDYYSERELIEKRINNIIKINKILYKNIDTTNIFSFYKIKKYDYVHQYTPKILRKILTNYYIVDNIIIFMSLPEKIFISSRCLKSFKIRNKSLQRIETLQKNILKIKNNKKSYNCNLINLILYKMFLRFKSDSSLENLIINLDNIDEKKFSKLEENSVELRRFKSNIKANSKSDIYNLLNDNIKEYLINHFDKYIHNTIFDSKGTYVIPLKSQHAGGKNKKILCLDFDETLGSFHINYSIFSILLHNYKVKKNIIHNIQTELLELYHLRPNLKFFFEELKKMKKAGNIDKIYIISRNRDYYNNYFKDTVSLIEKITKCNGLIDSIKTNVALKDLNKMVVDKNKDIIYIVDDKCEHVIPSDKCITINPYIVYEDYTIFIEILKKAKIDNNIIEEINKELIIYTENDFNDEDELSYINQYPQIKNFKKLYKPTAKISVRKYDDDELLRILNIIEKLYK